MKKRILLCLIPFIALLVMGSTGITQEGIDFSPNDELVILYKVGNNDITIEVEKSKVADYTTTWEWTGEPTVLMYAADGRTHWIMESEVELYKEVGWSIYPPITLYGYKKEINVLVEQKQDYLNTGVWFETYEEANPSAIFTYEVFTKSNLSVAQLDKILFGTGLEGCGIYFKNMEQEYNVNSLFAIAVACHESGNGFHKANTNNYFGFRGSNGWMSFSSKEQCIYYFGQLMNKKTYYGKSIEGIAKIYCNPPGHWITCIKKHMQDKWNKL